MASSVEVEHCLAGAEQVLQLLGYHTVRHVLVPSESSDTVAHALVGNDGYVVWMRTSGDGLGAAGLLLVAGGSAVCPAGRFPAVEAMHRSGRSTWGAGFVTLNESEDQVWCGLVWKAPIAGLDASSPEDLVEVLTGVLATIGVESRALGEWCAAAAGGVDLDGVKLGDELDLSLLAAAVGTPPQALAVPPEPIAAPDAAVAPNTPADSPATDAPTVGSRIRW